MSGSVASAPQPGDLAEFLGGLDDEGRRFVIQQLLPQYLAAVRDPRTITGPDGRVLGYYLPAQSLDGHDLLRAAGASDSGSFPIIRPAEAAQAPGLSGTSSAGMTRRAKAQDLFAELGGSD